MWGRVFWGAVAVAMVLGGGVKASAEMYLWTDEQGVVHMTNQWANVPESARAQVSVRDDAPPLSEHTSHGTGCAPCRASYRRAAPNADAPRPGTDASNCSSFAPLA